MRFQSPIRTWRSHTVRGVIRTFLEKTGAVNRCEAVDGRDAREKAAELKPDLIVLDLKMPVMNGVEAASVLKSRQIW